MTLPLGGNNSSQKEIRKFKKDWPSAVILMSPNMANSSHIVSFM